MDSLRFFGWLGKLSNFSTVRNLSASSFLFERFFWLICQRPQRQLLQVTSSLEVHGHSSNLLRLRLVYLLHCTLPLCVILCCALVAVKSGGASEIWGFQWWKTSAGSIPPGILASRRGRKFFGGGGGFGFPCCDAVCYIFWFLGKNTHRVPGKVEDFFGELAIDVDIIWQYDIETLILWRFVDFFFMSSKIQVWKVEVSLTRWSSK